ncbi:hypothetical protein F53441_3710 [Fusarium austroafricanum]|uniref:Uncharacterized protein n=1 Tax=Fusarium austroafricanum TaxID=2364996 RepID=A0A8H4KPL1_9HYPO|nr:hypothetical protein F53441_3710 [Fusarium austroafricanum]
MAALPPILAIGLIGHGGMTLAQLTEATGKMAAVCKENAIYFDAYFIPAEPAAEDWRDLHQRLESKAWRVVSIGSGLRITDQHTALLEGVVNAVLSTVHPTPKLAFPTLPEEMIPTFKRLLESDK